MQSAKSVGRVIGALVLLHLATGLITPYVILQPVSGPATAILARAAALETQIRIAVSLLVVGGVIPVAIAITAGPVLAPRHRALGQWLLALAAVSLAMQVVEIQHYLSLLSLAQEHGRAVGPAADAIAATAPVVRAAWRWAHYTHLLSVVGWILLFWGTLLRLAWVPRWLSGAGLVTTLMQLGGITLPVLLGYRVPLPMEAWGMPLGAAYVGLSLWLMARGLPGQAADPILEAPGRA